MKDENYIALQGWQVRSLRLAGDRLVIYAAIYGFTQDGSTAYKGGYPYLMEWTGKSRDTIRRCLDSLEKDGLIIREEEAVRGVTYVNWRAVIPPPHTDEPQNAATPPQNAAQEYKREYKREYKGEYKGERECREYPGGAVADPFPPTGRHHENGRRNFGRVQGPAFRAGADDTTIF